MGIEADPNLSDQVIFRLRDIDSINHSVSLLVRCRMGGCGYQQLLRRHCGGHDGSYGIMAASSLVAEGEEFRRVSSYR